MSDNTTADLTGRTIAITGSTDGLGRALALRLAAAGAQVIVHGRDERRAGEVAESILAAGGPAPQIVLADLSQLAQVDRLADEIATRVTRLDVLVNNAGIGFGRPDAPRLFSSDGFELRWAVNHLAPYRLTRRLLPLPQASAPARVVNVASAGQQEIDFDDLSFDHDYDGVSAYRRSKLAQIMSTFELAADLTGAGVTVNALHPATFMDTTMVAETGAAPQSTVAEGVEATLRVIADPALAQVTGHYFHGLTPGQPHPQALNPAARRRLRELTDTALSTKV
ncbi:SDR family NAD(P)-dependent oxidoreductase [Nocardia sp. NPDC020380]|uniref:SDR family NAD(P)-dependent oxidoreductase n=1 Tax=Nocardia sp. NPDC020380 TaxID=3364309 RepID=UPI00379F8CB8